MGIFDKFKRKTAELPEDDGPSAHYAFAHYALRNIALAEPLRFLAVLASPDARMFIESVLEDVANNLGCPIPFKAQSVKIHIVRVKSFPCAIIELPRPKEMAEAHMVASVLLIDTDKDEPLDHDSITARYFTLEKGFGLSNEPRTVLAEWDSTSHSNYGDGPPVDVEAFRNALTAYV